MNILVVSAHPDDETIGMGGTLLKLSKTNNVYWLIMTKAFFPKWSKGYIKNKEREIKKVASFYNFKKTFHAKFKTACLSLYSQQDITDKISSVCKETKPDIIFSPPLYDCHLDHELTTNAVISVVRPWNGFNVSKVVSYEIPVTTVFSDIKTKTQVFNLFEDISSQFKKKLDIMSFYKTELKTFPHPRSLKGLEIIAKERGLRSGFEYSESFSLLYARNILQ